MAFRGPPHSRTQEARSSSATWLSRLCGVLALAGGSATLILLVLGTRGPVPPLVVGSLSCLALYAGGHAVLRRFAFTVWVLVFVSAALLYPVVFGSWFGFDLKHLIRPLIQIIMFGMGTTLALQDFGRVLTMPWPVLVGMVLQFSVMPLVGFALAVLFDFPSEVAAGVVLIGSCSGGVASNLMTYLAGGNVALSVTMTACSTLMAPLATPFLMETLAGRFVEIRFVEMMIAILNIVVVPVLAGLVANRILYGRREGFRRARPLAAVAVACGLLAAVGALLRLDFLGALADLQSGLVVACVLVGVVALAKLVVNVLLGRGDRWMDRALPLVSMSGICFIIGIITARSSDDLLEVGLLLIAAAILHNLIGYLAGYWVARAARLGESAARTVAFEVGMQNGGMASGLAMNVLQSASAALAPAIFGPWMNVSGSVLATWWRSRPVRVPAENKESSGDSENRQNGASRETEERR